ncbi:hypothetical protein GCM10022222_81820 [Amycolatopsis ultiminotia]|uniref:Uncharacterized protein n=1 Tax=Amycolatopsis ultiminotia TaxID=543629 RepID=A0ABP6YJR5_9PSEU
MRRPADTVAEWRRAARAGRQPRKQTDSDRCRRPVRARNVDAIRTRRSRQSWRPGSAAAEYRCRTISAGSRVPDPEHTAARTGNSESSCGSWMTTPSGLRLSRPTALGSRSASPSASRTRPELVCGLPGTEVSTPRR